MKNKYYDDFRCCELKTTVKEVIEEKGFFWHVFEDTIFYYDEHHPDKGYINEYEVLKLQKKDGVVYHLLSEKLEGEVIMVLNHVQRYIHAQNETLSFLMNQLISSIYHCESVSHYITDAFMISHYKGKCLSETQKKELQVSLNGMIRDDYQVKITYEKITDERYVGIGLFPAIKNQQIQVPSLKFIQMVKILEIVEKDDGFVIITTCGDQMLFTMEKYYSIIKEASQILNCEPMYINTSIHHLLNKVKSN